MNLSGSSAADPAQIYINGCALLHPSCKGIYILAKLIEINDLHYAVDGNAVFEGINAEFYEGERLAIIGPLGYGKTTLLRLMLGFDKPQRGRVSLFGKDIWMIEQPELYRLRQRTGVIFENAALISNLKVIENIILPLQYHTDLTDDSIMEKAVSLLNHVGYKGDIWALPGPLPFYTKKTIALARAMALDPEIMIYDRLLEGLDRLQSLQLLRFVEEFQRQGKERLSIMIANDEQDLKDMTLDRVLRIENRRLVQ